MFFMNRFNIVYSNVMFPHEINYINDPITNNSIMTTYLLVLTIIIKHLFSKMKDMTDLKNK